MPQVYIRYFAGAAEAATCNEAQYEAPAQSSLQESVTMAALNAGAEPERLRQVLDVCSFLLNGHIADGSTILNTDSHCDIDVLPPFAGG